MSLPAYAIENRAFTYFATFVLVVAGIGSFFNLGQLEDPVFAVKTAVVYVQYPGASPEEVELEVTDRIEIAIQELPQLKYVESWSRAGETLISVEIKDAYWADQLPQVWDELRRKVNDVRPSLPPGVEEPVITDDFGDVFGFQLAVVGDGFTDAELEEFAKDLRIELSVVEGVARADLWGVQQRVIYLDVAETQLAELGLSDSSIENTLRQQNMVVNAGNVDVQARRIRIAPTGEFRSPEDIGKLTIRPSLTDSLQSAEAGFLGDRSSELIQIRDVGTVSEGYLEPPYTLMRFQGQPAIGLSITNAAGANVVKVGEAIDRRLAELVAQLPVGVEVRKVHWMSDVVAEATGGFLTSFGQAVVIVLVVLTVFTGWRMSIIIGTALVLSILATFVVMSITGIDLQRMSLGALIIALGSMVDSPLVVADGMAVRLQRGMERKQAAVEAAGQPAWPLLGATIIGLMSFYPIFASEDSAGEYCRTLFSVVGISLLASWVVSMTVTPLMGIDLLPAPKDGEGARDPFAGGVFVKFRSFLELAIRFRWLTIASMVGLLVVSTGAFGYVTQLFFPASSMNKFMIDFYAPEGTRIQQVAAVLESAEEKLMADERVENVTAFIGAGPPRFYLPVDPEFPRQSYAQLIVNVHDFEQIDGLIAEINPWMADQFPDTLVSVRKFGVGPSNTWTFELRLSGPAIADPAELRSIADQGVAILENHPLAGPVQTDWREPVTKLKPLFNQERARWSSITRDDIAHATRRAFDGRPIGLYREDDNLLPIILRLTEEERRNFRSVDELQVQSERATQSVPLLQVVDGVPVEWEDPISARRDRRRTITVQANPIQGITLPALREAVLEDVEAIELPPGYTMEWGGEYEDTVDAQRGLIPGVIPAVIIILLILVQLFNAFRPPVVILLTVPFAIIGVTWGLLAFDVPFGFVALLGAMSLGGLMIRNAVVLLDECSVRLSSGTSRYEAIVLAAVSRLRPVCLAGVTTVLGAIPLLKDVFWIGLAVTIMAGITFGTLLTMFMVPVFYATVYRLRPNASPASSDTDAT